MKTKNINTQGKNMVYVLKWFKYNFILVTYENKGYDKKLYPKLMLNRLNVVAGLTLIYTPSGTYLKDASIETPMSAPTKEAFWKAF
jgi:hypothetical protein